MSARFTPSTVEPAPCPGCGAVAPEVPKGETHRYMLASTGCWARFGDVLAREYQNPALMHIHPLTVDAYAVQHPGVAGPQSIQSVNVHLASLYAHFKQQVPLQSLADVRRRVVSAKSTFRWLAPPPLAHTVTVNDVWPIQSEEAHVAAVRRWASAAFAHWRDYHDEIGALLERSQTT
ncbi:MAG: DUF5946 family protein [Pseudomonadota bacterium]